MIQNPLTFLFIMAKLFTRKWNRFSAEQFHSYLYKWKWYEFFCNFAQELEAERVKLMEDVTANKRKMQELEDNLLYKLTSTKV